MVTPTSMLIFLKAFVEETLVLLHVLPGEYFLAIRVYVWFLGILFMCCYPVIVRNNLICIQLLFSLFIFFIVFFYFLDLLFLWLNQIPENYLLFISWKNLKIVLFYLRKTYFHCLCCELCNWRIYCLYWLNFSIVLWLYFIDRICLYTCRYIYKILFWLLCYCNT